MSEANKVIMNFEHPQWDEFINRLGGEEGCAFREEGDDTSFLCMSSNRPYAHALSVVILMRMNRDKPKGEVIDIPATIEWLHTRGGCCDCEVLFNVRKERKELKRRKRGVTKIRRNARAN